MRDWFSVFNGVLLAGFAALNFAHGHMRAAPLMAGFALALVVGGLVSRVRYLNWLAPLAWMGVLVEFLLHAPAGLMDGGIVTLPIMIYLIAGVVLSWHLRGYEEEA